MSTKELLKIVQDRGLRIVIEEGRPVIKRPPGSGAVTDKLLAVLKIHREWIIAYLTKNQ